MDYFYYTHMFCCWLAQLDELSVSIAAAKNILPESWQIQTS